MTSGPWLDVPPVPMRDVSLQLDPRPVDHDMVAVWAISATGDVLCRAGVTRHEPQVWSQYLSSEFHTGGAQKTRSKYCKP